MGNEERELHQEELARDLSYGNVSALRVVRKQEGEYALWVTQSYLPGEAKLMALRGNQRTWKSLDRLLDYLERLGAQFDVNFNLLPKEKEKTDGSSN